jgi:hypothetical protein
MAQVVSVVVVVVVVEVLRRQRLLAVVVPVAATLVRRTSRRRCPPTSSRRSMPQMLEDPNFYDGDTNLMSYAWFHGTMSSDEAFRVLETQPVGAYLVRVSAQRPACFVISFVADSDKVIHVVWEWNDTLGWTAEGRPDGFDTIKDILLAFKQVYNLAVLRP